MSLQPAAANEPPPTGNTVDTDLDTASLLADPQAAKERRARKARRLNLVTFPVFRAVGSLLLILALLVHNRFLIETPGLQPVAAFAASALIYSLVSWLLLVALYKRLLPFDLGILLLALDLPLWTWAIYCSGAEHSLLFFVLLMRVSDQTHTSFRRALFFGHLAALCYLAMLGWVAWIDQRAVNWPLGLTKLFFVYCANLYIALAARTAEQLRAKMVRAIRLARDSVRALWQQSEQLKESRRKSEDASRAKDEFMASMSHELRTPMNGVLGTADLLQTTSLDIQQREYVETLRNSAGSLLAIINDILDFARLEAGESRTESVRFQPRRLLREIQEQLLAKALAKGLRLDIEVGDSVPTHLYGDLSLLRQIATNLGDNAVKYTERGWVALRCHLVQSDEERATLRLVVEDSGIGIPAEDHTRIFDPFSQVDTSAARRHTGTGLGLAIVSRLTDLLGGRLNLHSSPGQGSLFQVDLPFALSEQASRILVVEHDPAVRRTLTRLLERLGYPYESTASEKEGTKAVQNGGVAAILVSAEQSSSSERDQLLDRARRGRALPVLGIGRLQNLEATESVARQTPETGTDPKLDDMLPWPPSEQTLGAALARWLPERNRGEIKTPSTPLSGLLDVEHTSQVLDSGEVPTGQLLHGLVRLFLRDAWADLAGLQRALEQQDGKAVEKAAKRLRAASEGVGARRLHRICREVEAAGRETRKRGAEGQGWLDRAHTLVPEIETQLQALQRSLDDEELR